jgi:hypothetical protein|tara:strand:+ start:440 stop:709 length:270 start_codon:yes stop_codon:yes gene_type:complete
MDKRINNGGARKGAGRKSKAAEQKLIENLTPMNDMALESLEKGLEKKEQWAVKLFFEYFYGKPQQRVDVTSNEETLNMPVITFVETETE